MHVLYCSVDMKFMPLRSKKEIVRVMGAESLDFTRFAAVQFAELSRKKIFLPIKLFQL